MKSSPVLEAAWKAYATEVQEAHAVFLLAKREAEKVYAREIAPADAAYKAAREQAVERYQRLQLANCQGLLDGSRLIESAIYGPQQAALLEVPA